MKRLTTILIFVFSALSPVLGQNNPYGIDDTCYEYFQIAETMVSDTESDAFDYANNALLKAAEECGDEKARTLYYVGKLKRASRLARAMDDREAGNQLVEHQKEETMAVARATGYMQYFYYAYSLCQTYYVNTNQNVHAQALLQEMMDVSAREGNEYGIWQSHSYLSTLYHRQNDMFNSRRHLLRAIEIYDSTEDETIRRQSITRQCCDMADTYPAGADSARYYYRKAEENAKTHLDSLRVIYYKAQLAAFDHEIKGYQHYRDHCLSDHLFASMIAAGDYFFASLDAIMDGAEKNTIFEKANQVNLRQQMLFLRSLAIEYKREDVASWMGSKIIHTFYADISLLNNMKMEEMSTAIQYRQMTIELDRQKKRNRGLWLAFAFVSAALIASLVALFIQNKKQNIIQ